jgi:hypothetical protein
MLSEASGLEHRAVLLAQRSIVERLARAAGEHPATRKPRLLRIDERLPVFAQRWYELGRERHDAALAESSNTVLRAAYASAAMNDHQLCVSSGPCSPHPRPVRSSAAPANWPQSIELRLVHADEA